VKSRIKRRSEKRFLKSIRQNYFSMISELVSGLEFYLLEKYNRLLSFVAEIIFKKTGLFLFYLR